MPHTRGDKRHVLMQMGSLGVWRKGFCIFGMVATSESSNGNV